MTFTTADEIQHVVNSISAKNRAEGDYLSSGQVFEEMRMRISLANRRAHLEALAACEFGTLEKHRQAEAITKCIEAWIADSPSVADWAEHELPEVVTKLLPYFAQSMDRWEWTLSHIIDVARLSDDVARDTIIRGLEMHASELNARTVYEVLVVLASRLTPADARKILEENLASLTRAIDPKQVRFYAPDIPSDTAAAIARLIFTMLGDLEMPARWQAAYCIRHAARCRNRKVLDALWDELNRKADNNFRIANAPYYWLASQLWMMIGLARAAHEAPDVLHHQVGKFVAIALNDEFPHLLIRHFAKQSIETLIATGGATLTDQERDSLEKVNAPQHFVLKETGNRNKSPPRNRGRGSDERRRFDFDSMDTLPYWYSGAVAPFADVDMREFIDLAECWIVDSWSNTDVKWAWKGEPRLARLENNGMASSHSHGSLPRLERFHTHLEWHAMWCAAGQLALSRPIVKRSEDEYDSWSSWYSSSTLTWPPFWLADFRQAKPLEMNLWFASEEEKDEEWLRGLDVESALKEIGLHLSRDEMVVDCEYSLAEHRRRSTIQVSSALISPGTASHLTRALADIPHHWDYKIPDEDDDLEIDEQGYKLIGYLRYVSGDKHLDSQDAFRREVSYCRTRPGTDIQRVLDINADPAIPFLWHARGQGSAFRFVTWSDDLNRNSESYASESLRSEGHRLVAKRACVLEYLVAKDMDLIVEVTISRRIERDEYSSSSDEDARAAVDFDQVFILRRDGAVEASSGRIGTWTANCPRAGR